MLRRIPVRHLRELIYEDWLRRDAAPSCGDVTLEACFNRHLLYIHAPACGYGPALEHDGDVYTCDHVVEPAHKLGNLKDTPLPEMVASAQMSRFGQDKRDRRTKAMLELGAVEKGLGL